MSLVIIYYASSPLPVVYKEQTSTRLPMYRPIMKLRNPDTGKKLIASIKKEMNLPRLAESVRTDGAVEPASATKRLSKAVCGPPVSATSV